MSLTLQRFLIFGGAATLVAACDPNVVIGAKWSVDQGAGDQGGSAGTASGGGAGGTETVTAGVSAAGDGGTPRAGGAAAAKEEWCATAPWTNAPELFIGESGNVMRAGDYVVTYVSGAQVHDLEIGYEVTGHYFGQDGLEAGHHIFSGAAPVKGATLWFESTNLVTSTVSVAEVEVANGGYTWPLLGHAGGELSITLFDDDYRDNSGPGSRFCIKSAAP